MCGITGIINLNKEKTEPSILEKMRDSVAHRGPDSKGVFLDDNVGLAHTRLAVIDPSAEADQPFISQDKKYVIVYNGTVYNFKEIKKELIKEGLYFKTKCDTEVVLNSYIKWGSAALDKFNGVFAMAILDRNKDEMFFARDRYGAKPLYYYKSKSSFVFGSELKVFKNSPDFREEVDPLALKEYFSFQNVFSHRTLYEGVSLLPAGSWAKLSINNGNLQIKKYWDYDFSNKIDIDYNEAVEELKKLLQEAVSGQLVSDVPLGSYLSGGMDSSTLAAIAGSHIKYMPTFTGGFYMEGVVGREAEFDERQKAEFAANHYDLPNYQVVMNSHTMPDILEELVYHNDDLRVGQCWQNYTVAHLASRFVRVVLCGAGGDELFAGYPWRYKIARGAADLSEFNNNYFSYWQRMVPENEMSDFFTGEIKEKTRGYNLREVYDSVYTGYNKKFENFYDRIFYFELKTFMQGLLLVEDKISMAHGMETRVPFLDNRLVDFVLKLPVNFKIGDDVFGGKKILRDAIRDLLPEKIFEYKKQGFSPPDENWYRKETAGYLRNKLLDDGAGLKEFIKKDYIEKVLDDHINKNKNNRLLIWSLLNFNEWIKS